MGHRSTLVQIAVNLLSNATKFVAPGVKPQIRVWTQHKGNWIRLWVEDNGIGIAPQYQQQIFGVFERLHGRDTYPGTGIGLAIVRKGAERLGGRAGVESVLGQGSRFWVEFEGAKL
jgi:signal transduction histidine kinase